jgi:Fe-S-cluster-containing dehydrogenase component
VSCCPTNVFGFDEHKNTVVVKDEAACIFCKECIFTLEEFRKQPEDELAVSVQHSSSRFFFTVETTGALSPRDVVKDALAQLAEKLQRLRTAIPSLNLY